MQMVVCPLCSSPFHSDEIEQHAAFCNGEAPVSEQKEEDIDNITTLVADKLPSETYSEYYTRKGAKPVISMEVPIGLKDSPFILYCPYQIDCGWMEASDFPQHAARTHDTQGQRFSCPICEIQGLEYRVEINLLEHLQLNHSDMKETVNTFEFETPTGEVYLPHILESSVGNIECAICFDTFSIGQAIIRTDCGCLFHDRKDCCDQEWFKREKRCPTHGHE